MKQYEEYKTENGTKFVKRTNEDGTVDCIPADQANSDYQRYLNPEADQPIGGNE
jgi:hypothetical protein